MPQSNRLIFREFTKEDYNLFRSVFTDERVMRYAYMDAFSGEDECQEYFNRVLGNNSAGQDRAAHEFAVFDTAGCFVGFCDIDIHTRNESGGCGEIGYFLLPEYWGKGYATEIAAALIDFCFTALCLHRVEARCNANNAASENVMRKAGLVREGKLRKVRPKSGRWDDEMIYGILKEEWAAGRQPG